MGQVEVDIAPLIGKDDGRIRVHVAKCQIGGTYLNVAFAIFEQKEGGNEEEKK